MSVLSREQILSKANDLANEGHDILADLVFLYYVDDLKSADRQELLYLIEEQIEAASS